MSTPMCARRQPAPGRCRRSPTRSRCSASDGCRPGRNERSAERAGAGIPIMSSILVTGGGGFIGAAVVEALAARGDSVAAIDIAASPKLLRLCETNRNVTYVPGELTEWPQLAAAFQRYKPDAVIHCAAIVGVINSIASPMATMRVNIEGSLNVLAAMHLFGVPRLLNLSSEEIYGPFRADRIDEPHPCHPVKPYGISKFAVEQLARDHAAEYGTSII